MSSVNGTDRAERDRTQRLTMEHLGRLIDEVIALSRDGDLDRITPRTRSALSEAREALRLDLDHLTLVQETRR